MRQDLHGVTLTLTLDTVNLNIERIFNEIKPLTSISPSMKSSFLKQLEGTKGNQAIKKRSLRAKLSKCFHVKVERLKITKKHHKKMGRILINFLFI